MKCDRCNRGLPASAFSFSEHRRFCDSAPLPRDMAEEFLSDGISTMYTFSVKYGLSGISHEVRNHIHFGMLLLGVSRADALTLARERSEQRMAARHSDTAGLIVKMPDPTSPDSTACQRCEILTTNRDSCGRPFCELCESGDIPWSSALSVGETKTLP